MPVFTIHQGVESTKSFPIQAIDTRRLRQLALVEGARVTVDIPSGMVRKPIPYPDPLEPNLYPLIHGACHLELSNATQIKSYTLTANGTTLCRGNNNGNETIQLEFLDDSKDCLLIDGASLFYSDLRFQFESDVEYIEPKLSFIPLLLDASVLDRATLASFDFVSKRLDGSYLGYVGGALQVSQEKPTFEKNLCENIAVKPCVDESQKTIAIYSHQVLDLVRELPERFCVHRDTSDCVIETWPPAKDVVIRSEHEQEVRLFCRERDPSCRVEDRGFRTYYTAEQNEEMANLSTLATELKYKTYCFIQGLADAPNTPLRPPQTFIQTLLGSLGF